MILTVGKRSGVTEPFNRDKIVQRRAAGLPGPAGDRGPARDPGPAGRGRDPGRGSGEIPSHEVGLAILGPLRELDEVAYLRFASVYRSFESLNDFEDEIAALRAERPASGGPKMSSCSPAGTYRAPPGESSCPPAWAAGPSGWRPTSTRCRPAEPGGSRTRITSNGTGPDQVRDGIQADSEGGKMTETTSGSARSAARAPEGAHDAPHPHP